MRRRPTGREHQEVSERERRYADGGDPRRRVQGRFSHSGQRYALWITDPELERRILQRPDGSCRLEQCYLTISLGEPYNGAVYKLIAAVIP